MLLTISTAHQPTSDLGFLLHKHTDKVQTFKVSGGEVQVFYPEFSLKKATIAMLLELDSIDLVRKMKVPNGSLALHHYVNDRPYVASSFASSAIANILGSAMNGNCKNRPELLGIKMNFEVQIEVLKVRGNPLLIDNIFEPLGYEVSYQRHSLDEAFPDCGERPFYSLNLKNNCTIQTLLTHLYILMPVFDNEKHYYVGKKDVDKLIAKANTWLPNHPMKDFITRRFLKNKTSLTHEALEQLMTSAEKEAEEKLDQTPSKDKEVAIRLHQLRLNKALESIQKTGAKSVLDLGCGAGKLLKMLLQNPQFKRILGMDVSYRSLLIAKKRLKIDQMSEAQQQRIELIHGSLLYRDERLYGFDAAAIVEVIEHLDEDRLATFEKILFGFSRPKTIVITTPNSEYNVKYDMEAGKMRHIDHRFEWSRQEFKDWTMKVCETYSYTVNIELIGDLDEAVGAPSQMAVFAIS